MVVTWRGPVPITRHRRATSNTVMVVSPRLLGFGSIPQPLPNETYGFLDVGANVLHFRALRNFFQR